MRLLVDNLVTTEEGQGVGVSLERIDHLEDTQEISLVVGGPRQATVQSLALDGRVDVEHDIDSGGIVDGHALVVVEYGVDVVDTDSVRLFRQHTVCFGEASTQHTPRRCNSVASRRQTTGSVRTSSSEFLLYAEAPPGW